MARLKFQKGHTKVNIKFYLDFHVDNFSCLKIATWSKHIQKSYNIHKVLPPAAMILSVQVT